MAKRTAPASVVAGTTAGRIMREHILSPLQRRILGERYAVRNMLNHMHRAGWTCWRTWDGEEWGKPADQNEVMARVFNLDEVSLRFVPVALAAAWRTASVQAGSTEDRQRAVARAKRACVDAEHGALIVLGNSPAEVLADWNYSDGDADGFSAAIGAWVEAIEARMQEFTPSRAAHADQIAVLAGPWTARDKVRQVLYVGRMTDNHAVAVRRIGECEAIAEVDNILRAAGLSAERVSLLAVDDALGGWRREVFLTHA